MIETDRIISLADGETSQIFKKLEEGFTEFVKATNTIFENINTQLLKSSTNELQDIIERFSFKLNRDNAGDLTSYAPRFGTFNQFLHIPCVEAFCNPKPFKGYFMPAICRKQFMQLKTFVNLRFPR